MTGFAEGQKLSEIKVLGEELRMSESEKKLLLNIPFMCVSHLIQFIQELLQQHQQQRPFTFQEV